MHQSSRAARASLLTLAALGAAACADRFPTAPGAGPDAQPSFAEAAAAWDGDIRIGVVQSASEVTIGSAGDYALTARGASAPAMTGSNGTVSITLESKQTIITKHRLQVACWKDVSSRKTKAESLGYITYTEFNAGANCTRLFLGEFEMVGTFIIRRDFRLKAIADGVADPDAFYPPSGVTTIIGTSMYAARRGSEEVLSPVPFVLSSSTGLVTIAGVPYRGIAEVVQNSGGTLAGVNELHIEDYLKGVVPRELPPVPYAEMEAQKAQAVAARTYATAGLGKRATDGYDLRATTSDQVYGGYAAEHPVSTAAIEATRGVVAVYNGRLIDAVFSSTTGGFTANNEEVFGSDPIAYLRGKPDAQRGVSLEHAPDQAVFKYARNASSLRGLKKGDYEGDWSRYHRWTFEWTPEEISDVISAYAGREVGPVTDIQVLERGPSGRVLRIAYITATDTLYDTKDRIRSSLKFINASGEMASLLSTLFYIEPVVDKKTGETGFVAYGGGWGHGVGLGQTGAVGMAEKGATYEEILKFYYTGIDVETRW